MMRFGHASVRTALNALLCGLAAKDTSARVRSVVGYGSFCHYVMLTPLTQAAGEREDVMV